MARRYKKLEYLFLQLCVMFFISYILSPDLAGTRKDIKDMYLYYFSYEFIGQDISIIHIITSIIPISLMISMFVDSLSYELDKNAVYIFTRTKKRTKWLLCRLLNIFIEIFLVDLFLFIAAFLVFSFLGYRILNFNQFIGVIFEVAILLILTQYILIIIANLISIKIDSVYGYIVSNLIYAISTLNFYYLSLKNISLLKYIPFTQHLVTIQDNEYVNRTIKYFSKYIIGYRFSEAIIYDLIILIIILFVGIRQINKAEFY